MMRSLKIPAMRLYQRDNGIWYIEYSRGHKISLKTTNKLLAIRQFNKLEQDTIKDKVAQLERKKLHPLGKYAEEYILSRSSKADNTQRIDRESFNKLIDYIGAATPIQIITRKQADSFIQYLQDSAGLSPVTINIALRHIKAAFKKAIEWEYLNKTPFAYTKELKIKNALPKALTIEQVQALLSAIEDQQDKELILTYLYTAGRRTEIARLRWQDVKQYDKGWLIELKETKSSVRIIPMADKLADILIPRKQHIGAIFPKWYYQSREVSRMFRKYADKAGLKNVKLHDLRHTAATFMILHSVDIRTVQSILGHSSVTTTEIYTKLAAEHLRSGINAINF